MQRFDDFMADALYGPEGFYTSGRGIAGRRGGDFITSPEVGPLFGAVLGSWLDVVWNELDLPSPFRVFDLGAGPGTLAKSIEQHPNNCGGSLVLESLDIAAQNPVPADLKGAVIIANELLDNVPFRWVKDGNEAFVEGGELVWKSSDVSLANGEYPVVEQAAALVQNLLDAGIARILAFDYGVMRTQDLADRGGWLRCYRDHQRFDDPLETPGFLDITTDVPIDQLPEPRWVGTQQDFLRRNGIDDLVEAGRRHWAEHAARPDLYAMEMRSRVREAEALLDLNALGSFMVMEWENS